MIIGSCLINILTLHLQSPLFVFPYFIESLVTLAQLLHRIETPKKANFDQSRIPFSKRKKEFSLKFLQVSVPFHSKEHLKHASSLILSDLQSLGISFDSKDLLIPVYSTNNGEDLRRVKAEDNLTALLVHLQTVEHVDWLKATQSITSTTSSTSRVTHIVDFGPGLTSGIGSLCARNMEGRGIQVILADCFKTNHASTSDKSVLFDSQMV